MNWHELEKHFSPARLGRYRIAQHGNTIKAERDYASNILLSEAMAPMLNVLEIALRNGIHTHLSKRYNQTNWWDTWVDHSAFDWQNTEVVSAKKKLAKRHEQQTPDKVIAELAFGFWSSLFNKQFQSILWKDLRLVFARCPKPERQRHNISSALNQIRHLRNRVFHHEPLLWLTPTLLEQHATGVAVINWIDPQLGQWLTQHDRLLATWASRVTKE